MLSSGHELLSPKKLIDTHILLLHLHADKTLLLLVMQNILLLLYNSHTLLKLQASKGPDVT